MLCMRLGLWKVVGDEKDNSDSEPESCLYPVLGLKRLKQGDAKEKQEYGEIYAQFDLHMASAKVTGQETAVLSASIFGQVLY